jgi:hypothetical protein
MVPTQLDRKHNGKRDIMGDDLERLLDIAEGVEYVGDDDDDDDDDIAGDEVDDLEALFGASEILAGYIEFVGLRRRRRRRRGRGGKLGGLAKLAAAQRIQRQAAAQRIERQGVNTIQARGDQARRLVAGTGPIVVTGVGQVVAIIRMQQAMRPDRIILSGIQRLAGPPAAIALILPSQWAINDIRVGTISQFSSLTGISGEMLARDFFSNGANLSIDTVQPGTDFSISFSLPNQLVPPDANNPATVQIDVQGRAMR